MATMPRVRLQQAPTRRLLVTPVMTARQGNVDQEVTLIILARKGTAGDAPNDEQRGKAHCPLWLPACARLCYLAEGRAAFRGIDLCPLSAGF